MKILIVGDTHCSFYTIKNKIDIAKSIGGIDRMVIVGDCGLWSGYEGVVFIDEINEHARANNMFIFMIRGNHDNTDWWNATLSVAPTSNGFAYLRTKVLLAPTVHEWRWAGKQFASAGGAVSIDKDYRIEYERKNGQKIWWPDEQLTDDEVDNLVVRTSGRSVDYLLTHDCSNRTPFRGRLKPDIDSQIHRQRIDKVLMGLSPRIHFHGHMHTKYEWMNFVGEKNGAAVYVQTYGLECNDDAASWGVLDTATDEFTWGIDLLAEYDEAQSLHGEL